MGFCRSLLRILATPQGAESSLFDLATGLATLSRPDPLISFRPDSPTAS